MFLKDLNANQQKLFLGLAKELIEADKKITDHEIAMIASLSGEMGQPEMICNPSDEVLEAFFPDKISRVAVMLELIGLSACDGDFSIEEDKVINRLKKVFGMKEKEVNACRKWVQKLYKTYAEAAKLFQ
ncbi:MAG TPA: hypothetical protein DCG57_09495 [Candidatus Riflebacteria bacterium]|nr:hypothetical protein [Candidatus Riflebacteria bacterium]